ncbi:HSF-type DNA-binding-domain-containing protein [Absidia repens]|uniref:HSF-type DNA-binding-domain-containing protein n=1 Tax=Absidia repens TaxID=90262 RepID=A0A1X2I552_9FUNG|nr:HSF-type DNA-binding-domain-containing protein [Absidia repens]
MTISPPQANCGFSLDYADDTNSSRSIYLNQHHSYGSPYVDQEQYQYYHMESTLGRLQPIMSSADQLPNALMLQSQSSNSLDSSNDGNNMQRKDEPPITSDNDSEYNGAKLYSRDNSYWHSTSVEASDQVSKLNKPMAVTNEICSSERGIAGFVSKLYQSLQVPQNNHTFVRWCRHDGKDMFLIDCIPRFTEEVLPRLFKHCKFQSFVRQLNIYGFQRDTDARKSKDTKDKEICRWHHPFFRPGRRDLIHLIRRKATLHTRRKRIQPTDQNPETLASMDSGDDYSDGDGEISSQQRHSSASNSIPNLSSQPSRTVGSYFPLAHHPTQDIHFKTNPAPYFSLVDSIMHQTSSPSSSPPPTSKSSSSLYMQEALQSSLELLMEQSMEPSIDTVNSNSITCHDNSNHPLGYQNTDNATQLSSSSSSSASSATLALNMENELQQHLFQLQISYSNDRDFYTKQIQLAQAHIKEQQAHIEQLETISALRKRSVQNQQNDQHIHQDRQQIQQQSTELDKSKYMALIKNDNFYSSDTAANYIMKNGISHETLDCGKDMFGKPNSIWSALSSPNEVPNSQYYLQNFDFYSVLSTDTVLPPCLTPSNITDNNLSTALLLSSSLSHTKKAALQQ